MNKETVVSIILISFLFQFFPPLTLARTQGHTGTKPTGEFCAHSSSPSCPMKNGAKHCPLMDKTSYHRAKAPLHPNNYDENRDADKPHCDQIIQCADKDPVGGMSFESKDIPCLTGTFSLDHLPAAEGHAIIKASLYKQFFKSKPKRPPSNT